MADLLTLIEKLDHAMIRIEDKVRHQKRDYEAEIKKLKQELNDAQQKCNIFQEKLSYTDHKLTTISEKLQKLIKD